MIHKIHNENKNSSGRGVGIFVIVRMVRLLDLLLLLVSDVQVLVRPDVVVAEVGGAAEVALHLLGV